MTRRSSRRLFLRSLAVAAGAVIVCPKGARAGEIVIPGPGYVVCQNFVAQGWSDQTNSMVVGRINGVTARTISDAEGNWVLQFVDVPTGNNKTLAVWVDGEIITVDDIDIVECV